VARRQAVVAAPRLGADEVKETSRGHGNTGAPMRLLTRSDFDGLACAVLLVEAGIVDAFTFVHPKDVQDGKIAVTANDVLANIPFAEGCGLWFDHHASEHERLRLEGHYKGASRPAPSAARVIWDYYDGHKTFGVHFDAMMAAVDKADSGCFTADEILKPDGWGLLSFVMDPRTGLGRYRDYRISNYDLMMSMIDFCRTMSVDEMLSQPDVVQRVDRYFEQEKKFETMLAEHTRIDGPAIVTDLRGVDEIFTGNRFVIYAKYPAQNVSVWVVDGREKRNAVFAVGHSILNRTCGVNVGSLLLKYGGGGHERVGTCQVPYAKADRVMGELIDALKKGER
jgi:nanoRNase/pAp phosphatase (c-di-AMP/oligoRNAs hydrolase)